MQRNDFDTFDELVRGKLTDYNEPPDPVSLTRIHAKKARITSLYQVYRLLLVVLVAGIGMFVSTLFVQPTANNETTSETSPAQQSNNVVNQTTVRQAEFASDQSRSESQNIQQVISSNNSFNEYKSTQKEIANTSSAPSHPSSNSKTNSTFASKTTLNRTNQSNTNTTISNNASSGKNVVVEKESSTQEEQQESQEKTNSDIVPIPETENNNQLLTDSVSKTTNKNEETCDVAFDYYSSYTGEFTFHTTASSSNTSKLSWDFGDGNSSSEQAPVHKYKHSGTYTVTLVLTDGSKKCDARMSKEIVQGISTPKQQNLTLTGSLIAGNNAVPNGTIEVYTQNEKNAQYTSTFSVKTQADGSFNIPLTEGVHYLLKGYPTASQSNYLPTFWGNTTSDADASEIFINPGEQLDVMGYTIQLLAGEKVPAETTEQASTPIERGNNQVIFVDGNNNIVGMGHIDQNGNVVANASVKPGNYTAVNPNTGKSNPIEISNNGEVLSSPESLTRNDDDNKVAVFPNPVENTVNFGVNSENTNEATLVVMNVGGIELMRKSIIFVPGFNQLQYDISEFSPGIYYVMVFKDGQSVMCNRIMKMDELSK